MTECVQELRGGADARSSTSGWRRKPRAEVSLRVTVPCTRAQGEAIADADDLFADADDPPVLVADEPDPSRSPTTG